MTTPRTPRKANAIIIGLALITLFSLQPATYATTQEEEPMTKSIMADNGIAIGGYDPVAYFQGTAQPGVTHHSTTHRGVKWLFASGANKAAFDRDPDRYTPQYGGYCALAMSLGDKAPSKPESWAIVDDKLYLNGNGFAKLLFKWIPGRISSADEKWAGLPDRQQ